jgi:hypothetical protein
MVVSAVSLRVSINLPSNPCQPIGTYSHNGANPKSISTTTSKWIIITTAFPIN